MRILAGYGKKIFFASLFMLLLALVMGINWLGNSQSGLRWLMAQAQQYAPGQLEISRVEGTLLSEIRLKHLSYRQKDGLTVRLEQFLFNWNMSSLVNRHLEIERLQLDSVWIKLPPQPPQQDEKTPGIDPKNLPTIQLPLSIHIQELLLNQLELHIEPADSTPQPLLLSQLQLKNIDINQSFEVNRAVLKLPEQTKIPGAELKWNLTAELAPPYVSQLALSWHLDLNSRFVPAEQFPRGLTVAGDIKIQGDLNRIHIEKKLTQPLSIHANVSLSNLLEELLWESEITWRQLDWPIEEAAPKTAPLLSLKQGELTARGDLKNYSLTLASRIESEQIPSGTWNLQGEGDLNRFNLQSLEGVLLDGRLKSQGDISWKPQLKARLETQIQAIKPQIWKPELPVQTPIDAQLALQFEKQRLNLQRLAIQLPQTEAEIAVVGEINGIKTESNSDLIRNLQINLQIDWQKLQWPLQKVDKETLIAHPPLVRSGQGKMNLNGGVDDFLLTLKTDVSGKDIPASEWNAELHGDQNKLKSFDITGQLLDGQTRLQGQVDWTDWMSKQIAFWNVAIEGSGLKPDKQWPEIPGLIGFSLDHHGKLRGDKLDAVLNLDELSGNLMGYPVRIKADLKSDGITHHLNALDFASGKNRAKASAKISMTDDPQIEAQFNIHAPNIANFVPKAAGKVKAQGKIQGKLMQPRVDTTVRLNQFRFDQWSLAHLDSKLFISPQSNGKIDWKVRLNDLQQQKKTVLKKLALTAKGRVNQHNIRIDLNTINEHLNLALKGGFDQQEVRWKGWLQGLNLETQQLGHWYLDQPAGLALSAKQAELNNSCFKRREQVAKICTQASWLQTGNGALIASIEQLSLSQLSEPFLPPHIGLTGMVLNGNLETRLSPLAPTSSDEQPPENIMGLDSDIRFNISPGKVLTLLEGRQYQLPFKGAELKAGINHQNGLVGQLNSRIFDKSQIRANWHLKDLKQLPLPEKQSLDAELTSQFLDLDIIPSLSPMVKNTQGKLDLKFNLAGYLDAPEIDGRVDLNAETDIPMLGLQLREIKTRIKTEQGHERLGLTGSIQSGEGTNRFEGRVDLSNLPHWQGKLRLYGDQFRAIHNDDFKVWIAPDIHLSLQPEEVEIDGQLKINQAKITPTIKLEAGGSKVNSSNDVVVVDEEDSKQEVQNPLKIKGNLELLLGQDIRIDVADFKSGMQGQVKMNFEPGNLIPRGRGEINIVDGTYKAYGQDLEVSQGRIFFQGTAMDNPGLGIRAIRRIKNNAFNAVDVAGIDVRGTAKSPRISLFSEPRVSDADIISYIVTGSAITAGDIESRELTLGTYISPSFYVSFGYDLFEADKSFNLRYDINKRWGIEGLAGDRDSGVDVSFTLGRD